ncbi:MAG: MFS transporter [Anaerolineae bacterium]|nr:MFS transporter [Anaerolineae bacterium]
MSGEHKQNIRTFYTLILTQVFSMIGSRISSIAIGIYLFQQTGNATPLAMIAFFTTLPMVLASSISGVLADRWDRRMVMVLSDTGQAVCTLLLFISFASGSFELWHLYVIVTFQSVFGVFQGPAFQASVTMLIPNDQRDRANAIQQLSGPSAGIIAPAIAGVIYALGGVSLAILVDMLTFVVAMVVIFSIHIPRPVQTEVGKKFSGTFWKEIWSGLAYLRQNRPLLYNMLYISMINFFFAGMGVLMTPYILGRTGSEITLGTLQSVQNLGAIAGGITLGVWGGTKKRMHTILVGILIAAMFMMGVGMSQNAIILGAMMFCFMFPLPIVNGLYMSLMQAKVAPDMQGRVFAVVGQFSTLLMPLSFLLVGPLADNVFAPAVMTEGWATFAPFVGTDAGSGYGLMMMMVGFVGVLLTLTAASVSQIRNLEDLLPDYVIQDHKTPAPDAPHPTDENEAIIVNLDGQPATA